MDAWRKTRGEKNPFIDKAAIVKDWHEQYSTYAAEREEKIKTFAITERAKWAEKAVFSIEAFQEKNKKRDSTSEAEKWQLAARRATNNSATVSRQAIVCEYLAECMRGGQFEDISFQMASQRLDEQVKGGNIVKADENRFTSWEMIIADRQYMDIAGKTLKSDQTFSKEAVSAFVTAYQAEIKEAGGRTLSEVQSKAVCALLASKTRLSMVQGDAGAGKTTSLKAVADFYKAQGIEVVGLAMQGVAANNLQEETGVASVTLASFLSRPGETSGRVLIVDEASMVDSRTAAKFFSIAEDHNDKIIFVGDVNQLESISAGRVFERLVADYQQAGELVNLNENFRQKDVKLRKAIDFARTGKMGESLNILEGRGDIFEIEHAGERRFKIANLYDKDTLIITTTQAGRDELNTRIRSRLVADGSIDEKKQKTFEVARQDKDGVEYSREITLAANDVVTFCKNEYGNYDVRNGERGVVLAVKDETIKIELKDQRVIDVDIKKYKNIDYGYAMTTFKAQGQTYNKVIVDSDTSVPSLNDMRNVYVNITRARDDVKIYTDDKEFLKELAEIKTHAVDTMSGIVTNLSHAKEQEARISDLHIPIKDIPVKSKSKGFDYTRDL
jgi:ATP-dependent exoDNAse (exonuclease V) alpha subunit